MWTRTFSKVLLIVGAILVLLALSGILFAQGRSAEAFERVKEVQERHTRRLMAVKGVEGTAVGLGRNNRLAVKIYTARPGIGGLPDELDGVPVDVVVTGKFYALPKGGNGKYRGKGPTGDRESPSPPIGLTATAISDSEIVLNWIANGESDLSHYNVYCSTATGGPYSEVASYIESNTYVDTPLEASTTYYYVLTAVDTSGNESADSQEVWAETMDSSFEPPIGPRPAPIGVSTGHPNITAGTIACRVTDGTNVYALSNNHVYANENNASIGDNVLQPGAYDGGQDPRDAIGTLADFEPIQWWLTTLGINTIDAAIALTSADRLGNATPPGGYGAPRSEIATPFVGLEVQKYGRTTGLTTGQISGVNATISVEYPSGTAMFIGQIIVGQPGFCSGGDSGSLVVTRSDNPDQDRKPVGLLFAASEIMTVANPIDAVLTRFGVTIDGE